MKLKIFFYSYIAILLAGCSEDIIHNNPYDPDIKMKTFIEEGYTTLEIDNVFRAADSPYFIDKDLIIRAQLMIEPGTELRFSPGVGIIIENSPSPRQNNSALIAIGTEDTPIIFSAAGSEDWAGIKFYHLEKNNSILKYCRFENTTIKIEDDTMTVENCNFQDADLEINGEGYGDDGPVFWGNNISQVMVRDNYFWGDISIYKASPSFLYNEFMRMTINQANPIIAYNKCVDDRTSAHITMTGACNVNIHHNTFEGFELQLLGEVTANVQHNVFNGGANWMPFYNFERFIWMRTTDDSGINVTPKNNILTLTNNNFYGSAGGQFISLYISGGTGEAIQTSDIDAVNNYWGTSDSLAIEAAMYDKMDESELGRVNFVPFHSSPLSNTGAGW